VEEGPKHTGEFHDPPFSDEHDGILGYPVGVVHQSLGAVGNPNQPPQYPEGPLKVAQRRHLVDAVPEPPVQLDHRQLDGLVIRVAQQLIDEARRRRRARGWGGVERVGGVGDKEDEEVGGGVGCVGGRGEGVGVPRDDARVGEDEAAEVRDGVREARPERGVADGGDLAGLVGGAAEGGGEEGEGRGLQVREGEAVDEEALGDVPQREERARLGEELGGGELEVGDGGAGVGRGRERDEEDLAEDDVLHLVGRALRACRRWGCHRRRLLLRLRRPRRLTTWELGNRVWALLCSSFRLPFCCFTAAPSKSDFWAPK
jgi:hypothetical protein